MLAISNVNYVAPHVKDLLIEWSINITSLINNLTLSKDQG